MAADPIAVSPDEQLSGVVDHFLQARLAPPTREAYDGELAIFLSRCAGRGLHPLWAARPDIDRYATGWPS